MTRTTTAAPPLTVSTRILDDPGAVLRHTLRDRPLAFVRNGDGIVGIGEALRFTFTGPDRMRDAAAVWRSVVETATVDDPVQLRGSGLVAFGSFAFADDSADESVLIVPRVVLGRRRGKAWLTAIDTTAGAEPLAFTRTSVPVPHVGPHVSVALRPGRIDEDTYAANVSEAVRRIVAGGAQKVVLARDLVGTLPSGADRRAVLLDLAAAYPQCVTFAVDGLVGATPETLARTDGTRLTARVLAGSAARGADEVSDRAAAEALATSAKDVEEHAFAIDSLLAALAPLATDLRADAEPFRLQLPNLWHLATDVQATLPLDTTSLDVADALHPTAAVAGTPTDVAVRLVAELEGVDRGRYAGPVGWMSATGDGEWMLALRSARIDDDGTVRAWAGAGIVAGSEPAREVAETALKFRPITDALA
ncbi:isochorismate synthase [Curtobacterium aurantiacum]|uniref:isochorismate synthase n=1 Tax=Curtobacterium aurantiacum TaxID=3236919 RepID=A0ABS5VIT9_9MICO|nr:isochorismate synthase [Curtobacterium flaccumfaciens]MBT1546358.1 isochorismate synthase [Curtobacterium flaccumfaciens pv. flaccumfaciens]MBT1588765.1 isochorismate synthase [Curtobacterium flaccumfaciens pv. flaccumfaciens]